MNVKVGQGFDVHRLVAGPPLRLCGLSIPFERGLEGHSDGDAGLHAVADAILGAMGQGDIGGAFPSSDVSLEGLDSVVLLERVVERMREGGFELGNLDCTIIAQVPRLAPFQEAMGARLAEVLGVKSELVNLKVTSTDKLGTLGREEGIAALAVVLIHQAGETGL